MAQKSTPTYRQRKLAKTLYRLRTERGVAMEDAATALGAASSKVSRIETATTPIRLPDLNALIGLYELEATEDGAKQAEIMRELARNLGKKGRWSGHMKVVPDWFRTHIDLEQDASLIRMYECEVMPGFCQNEGYTRAIFADATPRPDEPMIENHIQVRKDRRKQVLEQAHPPTVQIVISESALRASVAPDDLLVMIDQLNYLIEMSRERAIQLQVLPFDLGTYVPRNMSFSLLRFEGDNSTDLCYLEDYTDATYLDDAQQVAPYNSLWDRIMANALNQEESRRVILGHAEEFRRKHQENES